MKLLIQGMAQCILHSDFYSFEERLFPKHLLLWQLAVLLSPMGQTKLVAQFGLCQVRDSSGPIGMQGMGSCKAAVSIPRFLFCPLCQLASRILFLFFFFYTSPICIHSSRKECVKFCCRTCCWSTQLYCCGLRANPPGTHTFSIKLPNSWKQMSILNYMLSLCYSNLEKFPSHRDVPRLHGSIWAGEEAAGWATALHSLQQLFLSAGPSCRRLSKQPRCQQSLLCGAVSPGPPGKWF